MDGVGAEVDGVGGCDEVVETDAALRGEVPDAGVGVGTVIGQGEIGVSEGRILVVGPQKTARGLRPRCEAMRACEVPTKDDGSYGDAGEGAADGVVGAAEAAFADGDLLGAGVGCGEAAGFLGFGRVGLPEGEELGGVLEVAAHKSAAVVAGEDLACVDAGHEELEVVAVFRDADAALDEGAELEGEAVRSGLGDAFLSARRCDVEQGECGGGDEAIHDAAKRQAELLEELGIGPFYGRCAIPGLRRRVAAAA